MKVIDEKNINIMCAANLRKKNVVTHETNDENYYGC